MVLMALLMGALATNAGAAEPAKTEEPAPEFYSNRHLLDATHVGFTSVGSLEFDSPSMKAIDCEDANLDGGVWNESAIGKAVVEAWTTYRCSDSEAITTQEHAHEAELLDGKIQCVAGKPGEGGCLTVYVSDELPPDSELREAEVCKEEAKKLSECKAAGERETKRLVVSLAHPVSSLPWDARLETCEKNSKEGICEELGIPDAAEQSKGNTSCYKTVGNVPASYTEIPAGCVKLSVVIPQIPVEIPFYGSQTDFLVNGVKNGLDPSRLKFIEAGPLDSSEGSFGEAHIAGELKLSGNSLQLIYAK